MSMSLCTTAVSVNSEWEAMQEVLFQSITHEAFKAQMELDNYLDKEKLLLIKKSAIEAELNAVEAELKQLQRAMRNKEAHWEMLKESQWEISHLRYDPEQSHLRKTIYKDD